MREFIQKCPYCQSDIKLTNEWIGMTCQCPVCSKGFPVKKPAVLKKLSKSKKCRPTSGIQIYAASQPVRLKFVIAVICIILSLPLLATFYVWLNLNIDINESARKQNYSRQQIREMRELNTFENAGRYVFKRIAEIIKIKKP